MYQEGEVLSSTTHYEADITLVKELDKESGLLIEARPRYTKPYPIPNKVWGEVNRQIDEMECHGIIR